MNPSTEDSFKERTLTGALSIELFIEYYIVSVITIILMGSLFWGEFKLYITNVITFNCFLYCSKEQKIWQWIKRQQIKRAFLSQLTYLSIFFLINLMYSLPCDLIQVGYRDALGNDRVDIENEILKTNLDVNGNTIGNTDVTKVLFLFGYDIALCNCSNKRRSIR